MVEVQDMLRTQGLDNDGGIKVIIYFALASDVKTWPVAKAEDAVSLAERVSLTGDFVMKVGKKFGKFEVELERGALDSKGVGAVGNSSAENIIKMFRFGHVAEILGWIESYKNCGLVLIAEDLQGKKRVLGAEGLPAQIMPDWEVLSGSAVSDEKYVNINVRSVGRIAKFYAGEVPLVEAVEGV